MKSPLLHPILFGIFPILFLYSRNLEQVDFSKTILPFTLAAIGSLLLLASAGAALKNIRKAGLVTSAFLIWFFSYGHIYDLLDGYPFLRHRYLLAVTGLVLLIVSFEIIKSRRESEGPTKILNCIGIILLANCLFYIGTHHRKAGEINAGNSVPASTEISPAGPLRDIYYIILDAYAGEETLKRFFGFDNSGFIRYLTAKGFYVASESRSNYAQTAPSLASSLNMEYLPPLSGDDNQISRNFGLLLKLIENNKVQKFLKSQGYKFYQLGSWYSVTELNRNADVNVACGKINEFALLVARTSVIGSFWGTIAAQDIRGRILCTLRALGEMGEVKGPKFVFAHIICPHPPYVFGANGERVEETEKHGSDYSLKEQKKYFNQVLFINKQIEETLEKIFAGSGVAPIIILQGDHGPSLTADQDDTVWIHPDTNMIRERMMILNAYYFPGEQEWLYSGITPVNSFRILLDRYFGTHQGLLKDHCFYSPLQKPYAFRDITQDTL